MISIDPSPNLLPGTISTKSEISKVKAPLVVGVIGHRDLRDEDLPKLSETIKSVFLRLKKEYPFTPLLLLSDLTEGANRLAARVAISKEINAGLFVLLPMERASYESGFRDGSLVEFGALLEEAEGFIELPSVKIPGKDASLEMLERLQHERLGKYIVQNSQILIALWDGAYNDAVGAIVQFQLTGLPRPKFSFNPREGFPVYHILTPSKTNPAPDGMVSSLTVRYPEAFRGNQEKASEYYSRMFHRLDEFNRQMGTSDRAFSQEVENSKGNLLKDLEQDGLSAEYRTNIERYSRVDILAVRLQQKGRRQEVLLHAAIFFVFTLFVLFAHINQHPAILFITLVSVLFAVRWRDRIR